MFLWQVYFTTQWVCHKLACSRSLPFSNVCQSSNYTVINVTHPKRPNITPVCYQDVLVTQPDVTLVLDHVCPTVVILLYRQLWTPAFNEVRIMVSKKCGKLSRSRWYKTKQSILVNEGSCACVPEWEIGPLIWPQLGQLHLFLVLPSPSV